MMSEMIEPGYKSNRGKSLFEVLKSADKSGVYVGCSNCGVIPLISGSYSKRDIEKLIDDHIKQFPQQHATIEQQKTNETNNNYNVGSRSARRWHGTTLHEELYQSVAKLAEQHKRSVIKEIDYLLTEALKNVEK